MWKSQSHSISASLNLLELAIDGANEGITISDMKDPEHPLIFVNEGFECTTGYSREEVLGRNCRFLQGPKNEPENIFPLGTLKKALDKAEPCTVLLKNYRKNGELFWNRLSLTPIFGDDRSCTHFVGVQTDITAEILAKQETAEAYKKLAENFATMEQDLAHASFVQQSILPSQFPQSDSVNFYAKFEPMTHIGGDFYDVFEIKPKVYGVMIADVTGHGASAALLTLMASDVFKKAALGNCQPAEVLRKTNRKLYKRIPQGKFVTMFYGVLDEQAKTFCYCQAGHPCGYLIKGQGQAVQELSTDSSFLGVFDDSMASYQQVTISLNPGDKIVLYTDALIEAKAEDKTYFGNTTLHTLLPALSLYPIEKMLEQLYQSGLSFIQGDNNGLVVSGKQGYQDDITLLGFEMRV